MGDTPLVNLKDLAGLSGPATKLIEKVSDAFGALYEPTHIRRIANAEADAALIHAENKIKLTEVERRGLQRLAREEGRKQEAIESITRMAADSLKSQSDAKPEDIDDDWLYAFFEKAKLVTDEMARGLWAKVLAGEAKKKGSFSKRSLNVLSSLDSDDARHFCHLCKFMTLIDGHDLHPMIFEWSRDFDSSGCLDFDSLTDLDALGLIKNEPMGISFNLSIFAIRSIDITYGTHRISLSNADASPMQNMDLGTIRLTKAGRELYTIVEVEYDDRIFERLVQHFRNTCGFKVQRIASKSTQ